MAEERPATIGPESRVSLALLAGILAVTITGAFWVASVNARLGTIERKLDRPNPDSWTRWEMRVWIERLRASNSTLSIPTPD